MVGGRRVCWLSKKTTKTNSTNPASATTPNPTQNTKSSSTNKASPATPNASSNSSVPPNNTVNSYSTTTTTNSPISAPSANSNANTANATPVKSKKPSGPPATSSKCSQNSISRITSTSKEQTWRRLCIILTCCICRIRRRRLVRLGRSMRRG